MKLVFTKMQGAGNDFVVLDCTQQPFSLDSYQLKKLADRHFGVGCDQVLVVEKPGGAGADFGYRIFNADGGEVEQCGNGARCLARFLAPRFGSELTLASPAGAVAARVRSPDDVSVNLGVPDFRPAALPFLA